MKALFLFVRPPRPMWPFNGPSTAFWPPLAFASLAGALREQHSGVRVAILDAPALSMGWKSLTQELRTLQPCYVGIGEEAVSCVEGLRIARLAKEFGAQVIAGGCFFSHVAREVLATGLIDVVVHGEGEQTIVELVQVLESGERKALRAVTGISFRDDGEVVFTGWRELLADLDRLAFPAYDLLPIERYGSRSQNHRSMASIELGRGCPHSCEFCILWRQMGRKQGAHASACHRVKSPDRIVEEIRILMDRFGRKYLSWVDPCFNANPRSAAEVSDLLLREGRVIGQSAWVRADYLVRDHETGALRICHNAGLNEVYLGIERLDRSELVQLRKGNFDDEAKRALTVLDREYPGIATVGSFIYGFPWDTEQTVHNLFRSAQQLPLDVLFFIPLTPLPGTPYWNPERWDDSGKRFREFDFLPNPGADDLMGQLSQQILRDYLLCWPSPRISRTFLGLIGRDSRRRRTLGHIFWRALPLSLRGAMRNNQEPSGGMFFPDWYES